MSLKRFLLALTAVSLLAAVMASSASATMNAEGEWFLGSTVPGVTLPEGSSKTLNCAKGGPSNLVLTGTVGEEAGTPVKLEATGVECVETAIKNEGGHGFVTGKLKFSGVTIAEPAGCTVPGEVVETETLKAELYMDSESSTLAFAKFEPKTAGGNFAVVPIEGCAVAGHRIVKGSVFGEASKSTSTAAATQPLVFSSAIDATAGSALKFAGNEAHLAGTVNNSLTGGEEFQAHVLTSVTMNAEGEWFMGGTAPGTTLAEGTSKGVNCSRGGSSNLVLTGTVGEEAGTPVKLEATGVECVETAIKNEGGHGFVTGKLKFRGVTIAEPAGCTVPGGVVETETVKSELYMDSESSTLAFAKFEPKTAGGNFAVVPIEGCAVAGHRIVKGSVFGEAVNSTSFPTTTESFVFDSGIETTTGSALKFAGNEAHLAGRVDNSLGGGEAFMAHTGSGVPATMNAEGEWYLGASAPGTTLAEGTSKGVNCSKGGSSNLVLTISFAGVPVKLEATGVECIGEAIKNEGGHGFATGALKFTGVTVVEPSSCTVSGGSVTTQALREELFMDSASTTLAFVKFEPAVAGGNFADVQIEGCSVAGSWIVKGSVFGEASNVTDTPGTTQPLVFSAAFDATTGGTLSFGGNEAHLEGQVNNSLSSGEAFNAH